MKTSFRKEDRYNPLRDVSGSRTAATSKMEHFVIDNSQRLEPIIYHKEVHLGCCSSPRSASCICDSAKHLWSEAATRGVLWYNMTNPKSSLWMLLQLILYMLATTNIIQICSAQKISNYQGFSKQNLEKKNVERSEFRI